MSLPAVLDVDQNNDYGQGQAQVVGWLVGVSNFDALADLSTLDLAVLMIDRVVGSGRAGFPPWVRWEGVDPGEKGGLLLLDPG